MEMGSWGWEVGRGAMQTAGGVQAGARRAQDAARPNCPPAATNTGMPACNPSRPFGHSTNQPACPPASHPPLPVLYSSASCNAMKQRARPGRKLASASRAAPQGAAWRGAVLHSYAV